MCRTCRKESYETVENGRVSKPGGVITTGFYVSCMLGPVADASCFRNMRLNQTTQYHVNPHVHILAFTKPVRCVINKHIDAAYNESLPKTFAHRQPQIINEAQQTAEALRRRLTMERKETRIKLESMKEEVARVVRQSLARADRAEAAAASSEETARTATLRYLAAEKRRKK